MNLVALVLYPLALASTLVSAEFVTEFRIKVGDVLEKLKYPDTIGKINNLGDETMINTAIDFKKTFKPKLIQLALIPEDESFTPITFDMEYKESSSKATLNINLKKLTPGMINLGSKYTLKVFVSSGPQSKERLDWTLGNLVMPKSVDYKLPEIEDHFYKMPEIYTPEEDQKSEGKKNPIYQLIGIIGAIALPWICFIKMWKNSGSEFSIPSFLFNNSKSRAFPFFVGSLFCLFLLILSSWIFLNIFQTMGFLALFSLTAFVFGHRAFKTVVNEKPVEEAKKSD